MALCSRLIIPQLPRFPRAKAILSNDGRHCSGQFSSELFGLYLIHVDAPGFLSVAMAKGSRKLLPGSHVSASELPQSTVTIPKSQSVFRSLTVSLRRRFGGIARMAQTCCHVSLLTRTGH
jgi:hypothetical protein